MRFSTGLTRRLKMYALWAGIVGIVPAVMEAKKSIANPLLQLVTGLKVKPSSPSDTETYTYPI